MSSVAPRWLRSVRRRPAAFLAILLLSAGAALVSALTPMLVVAVDAVGLREAVAAAPFPSDGVAVEAVAQSEDEVRDASDAVLSALQAAAVTSDRWSQPEEVAEPLVVPRLFGPGRAPVTARYSLAADDCHGLRLTGSCPTSLSDGALAASLARRTGWRIGTELTAKVPSPSGDPAYLTLGTITVVGVYDDSSGLGRSVADPTRLVQQAPPRAVPNLLVGPTGVADLRVPIEVSGAVRVTRPVSASDVPDLRHGVAAARSIVLDGAAAAVSASVVSRLGPLLDGVAQQQSAAAVLAAPIGLEAVLLAWFALGAVAQRTARSRAAEWGVGRMRGARIRAWLAFVFTEPLVAVVAGAVLGYALALLVARVAAVVLLGTAQDVAPVTGAVLAGVGLAAAGSVVAIAAASVRAALLPLSQLLQDTAEPRRLTRPALVLQVALVSLAVGVAWSALTTAGFSGQQLGLLLPAMLALVAGIAAVHLAVLLVRRTSRRAPRSLTGLVVGRGLARAPSVLIAAQLMLVSAALAACALQLGIASTAVQTDRAELETGAARVLTVQTPAGVVLLDAVRRADPSGRVAMAAEQVVGTPGEAGDKVLAVDTARLAAVSTWRPEWREGVPIAGLAAAGSAAPVLRGTALALDVEGALSYATDTNDRTAVDLDAVVDGPDGWTTVSLGRLRNAVLRAAIPCSSGCRLIALALHSPSADPWGAEFQVTAMSTDRQPADELQEWLGAGRWRQRLAEQTDPSLPAEVEQVGSGRGLAVTARDAIGSLSPQLEPAVGAAVVPALLGSRSPLVAFPGVRSAVLGTSLAGTPMLLRRIGTTTAVPRALRTGVLVDLATIQREEDPSLVVAEQQVWLAPAGQQPVLARLRAAGVRVLSDERAATAVRDGLASTTNRALRVAQVTAVVGIAFGLLALIATRVVDLGERRREWRTLRLAGVPADRPRRLALVQVAVPAVIGALLGVLTGALAATLIVARLPLLVAVPAGPPFALGVPVGALAALAAVLVLLVALAAVAVSAVETRRRR